MEASEATVFDVCIMTPCTRLIDPVFCISLIEMPLPLLLYVYASVGPDTGAADAAGL